MSLTESIQELPLEIRLKMQLWASPKMMPENKHCIFCEYSRNTEYHCKEHWIDPVGCPCFECQIWENMCRIERAVYRVWTQLPLLRDEHYYGPIIFTDRPQCQMIFYDDDDDPFCPQSSDYRCSRCNKTYCATCFCHDADKYVKSTECADCAVDILQMARERNDMQYEECLTRRETNNWGRFEWIEI